MLSIKISPRENPLVAPVSTTEIVVLGGLLGYKQYPGDGFLINTESQEVTRFTQEQPDLLNFVSWGNSCTVVGPGQVTGLVKDSKDELLLVTYNKNHHLADSRRE